MFPCPYCHTFTFSLLQAAAGPEQLYCRFCHAGVSRALFAKPVGVVLLLLGAMLSLTTAVYSHTPIAFAGLVPALVIGRSYWPAGERSRLSRLWILVSVAVVALARLDGVL